MRFLYFFAEAPLNHGFFGFSLRKMTKILTFYQIFIRIFTAINIHMYLKEYMEDPRKYKEYPYIWPSRLVVLINNGIYIVSLIMVLFSTFSTKRITLAFLGNAIGSINVLIDLINTIFFMFIKKPEIDYKLDFFEIYITGSVFMYILIIEILIQYFIHSFCINLIFENYNTLESSDEKPLSESSIIKKTNSTVKKDLNIEMNSNFY